LGRAGPARRRAAKTMKPAGTHLRPASFLVLGAVLGLLGESLLLLRAHCLHLEAALLEDFRVLAFLKDDLDDSRRRLLEEKLRAMDGVEALRFVSSSSGRTRR
jgi:cell division protein FtsX